MICLLLTTKHCGRREGVRPVFLVPLSVACRWLYLPHGSGQSCGDLGLRGLRKAWRHDTAAFSALMITPGSLLGTVGARASRLTCELQNQDRETPEDTTGSVSPLQA